MTALGVPTTHPASCAPGRGDGLGCNRIGSAPRRLPAGAPRRGPNTPTVRRRSPSPGGPRRRCSRRRAPAAERRCASSPGAGVTCSARRPWWARWRPRSGCRRCTCRPRADRTPVACRRPSQAKKATDDGNVTERPLARSAIGTFPKSNSAWRCVVGDATGYDGGSAMAVARSAISSSTTCSSSSWRPVARSSSASWPSHVVSGIWRGSNDGSLRPALVNVR